MSDTPKHDKPSGAKSIKVRNIKATNQYAKNLHVQRLDIKNTDDKDAASDLMDEVNSSIGSGNTTLKDILKEIRDSNTTIKGILEKNKTDTKEENTGSTNTDKTSEQKIEVTVEAGDDVSSDTNNAKLQKRIMDITDVIMKGHDNEGNKYTYQERAYMLYEKMIKSVDGAFKNNIFELINKIGDIGTKLTDASNITNAMTEKFQNAMLASSTGIEDFNRMLFDIAPTLAGSADNLKFTMNTLRSSIEGDMINPLGVLGGNLSDVASSFYSTREQLDELGNIAYDRLAFDELNDIMYSLYSLEKRNTAIGDINSSRSVQSINKQINFLQTIAGNTGMTVEEIIKANRNNEIVLRNISASGGLTDEQVDRFTKANRLLIANNQSGLAELLQGVAQRGGNLEAYLADNDELASMLSINNQLGNVQELLSFINTNNITDDVEYMNRLSELTTVFGDNVDNIAATAGINSDLFNRIAGEASRGLRTFEEVGEASATRAIIQDVSDAYKQNDGALLLALGANTAAVIANTAMLARSLYRSYMDKRGIDIDLDRDGKPKGGKGKGPKPRGRFGKMLGVGAMGVTSGVVAESTGILGSISNMGSTLWDYTSSGASMIGNGLVSAGEGALYYGSKGLDYAGEGIGYVADGVMHYGGKGLQYAGEGIGYVADGVMHYGGKGVEYVGKYGGEALSMGGKKIPLVGAGVGIGLGISRALDGDFTGAGLEVASGVTGAIPGLGTATSIGIDGTLMARDAGLVSIPEISDIELPTLDAINSVVESNTTVKESNDSIELLQRIATNTYNTVVALNDKSGFTDKEPPAYSGQ